MEPGRLADRVRRIRLLEEWDQAEFARRLGIANGTVSKLEAGTFIPTEEVIVKISEVLRCSVAYLTSPTDPSLLSRPWLRAYADASKRALDRQLADVGLAVEAIEELHLPH